MRRRSFIALLGGAASLASVLARAPGAKPLPLVGLVFAGKAGLPAAFLDGLRGRGWVEGQTVVVEQHFAEDDPRRAPPIFAELLARGADVLAIGGARWLHDAALAATRTTPIVTLFQDDPVAAGLVASLARPGGNLTGVAQTTGPEIFGKRLQLLQSLAPGIRRVAFLGPHGVLAQDRGAARPAGVEVVPVELDIASQLDGALAMIRREVADALMVAGSAVTYEHGSRIATFAAEARLPAIYPFREPIATGGLISYGASIPGIFRQMGILADRILRGARPEDLPVEQASKYELLINAKTAAALGLSIPQTLLAIADEVVE